MYLCSPQFSKQRQWIQYVLPGLLDAPAEEDGDSGREPTFDHSGTGSSLWEKAQRTPIWPADWPQVSKDVCLTLAVADFLWKCYGKLYSLSCKFCMFRHSLRSSGDLWCIVARSGYYCGTYRDLVITESPGSGCLILFTSEIQIEMLGIQSGEKHKKMP